MLFFKKHTSWFDFFKKKLIFLIMKRCLNNNFKTFDKSFKMNKTTTQGDLQDALEEMKRSLKCDLSNGHCVAKAQRKLGIMLITKSNGNFECIKEGFDWLSEAAQHGDLKAKYLIEGSFNFLLDQNK